MTKATITIPDTLNVKKIPEELIYRAFAIAVAKKRKEIQDELRKTDMKIRKFEKKYNMTYDVFSQKMDDSFKAHNDWMDWGYFIENRKALTEELKNLASEA